MNVVDWVPAPISSQSELLCMTPKRRSDVQISVMLKATSEMVVDLDSSNPRLTTTTFEADAGRYGLGGNNSAAATCEILSCAEGDAPDRKESGRSQPRTSRNSLGRLLAADGMDLSTSDNEDNPFWSPRTLRRHRITLVRGSLKLFGKLRRDETMVISKLNRVAIPPEPSNLPPAIQAPEAEFDPHHVTRDNLEGATKGPSTPNSDDSAPARSFPTRGSRKLSPRLLPEEGMDPPHFDLIMNEESAPPQELASKLEESFSSSADEEGGQKRNSARTAFPDDEPLSHESTATVLQVQAQPGGRKEGLNRALKGIVSIQKGVTRLRKGSLDEYRRKVVVNGVPIKDIDVKKAEESAGPIHPGNYWYDVYAGFWGVEPGPCLGIVPPCILEFNTSMSKACAGGSTGILVNGRELHDKDLERLAFRGLSTEVGKAYMMSIDGRVVDESSKRHVTCLGMLAPSLGKTGRGTGMYVPFDAAAPSRPSSPPHPSSPLSE